ncbi:MAG: recombinase family protein [Eubacterium sp.]|nr:recombinase family protein [Eubacterium sp.]
MDKTTAIYVRRSVSDADKGNNSLSIAAQKEECIRFLGEGADFKIYCDDGKSGKDIEHRPAFQEMMTDARNGEISRIIVKKYDRFSRNMREYLNITDTLDKLGVSVISLSEPFNTETKEGRMMRNNLLNFAEFERETIAARVADAYDTKARETGFYQGGKVYFGYAPERRTINGKTGSVLVPDDKAAVIATAYEVYKEPSNSLKSVMEKLREIRIEKEDFNIDCSQISRLLESPLYVRADAEIYRYFASQGVEMLDDISAYDGVHGLFLHGYRNNKKGIKPFIKVGYHEGLVDSATWLAVQDKKSHNHKIPSNGTSVNSWLTGIVKCAHCGYSPFITVSWNDKHTKAYRYYHDNGFSRYGGCVKRTWKTHPDDVEQAVFKAMKERIQTIEIAKKKRSKPSAEVEKINAELAACDEEIRDLMDKLPKADNVLFDYIQNRIAELHEKKTALEKKLNQRQRKQKEIDTKPLSEPLEKWDSLTLEEKREVAATMIEVVRVSDENGIEIEFSI